MFVLGAYWARDPLRVVLGLRAQILVQLCNYNVKTPYFVGVERVVVKSHRVVHPYFYNVISAIEDLQMVHRPWNCIN